MLGLGVWLTLRYKDTFGEFPLVHEWEGDKWRIRCYKNVLVRNPMRGIDKYKKLSKRL
jgi:hypothetical protein